MLNIILLGLTSLLTDASSEMVYPLIPLYLATRLGQSPAIIGLIEGFAESLASLVKVFSGNISDRVRRRKPLTIFGYSLSSAGRFILYFAQHWGLVFLARITDRFGKGVRTAPRDALIADSIANRFGMAYGLHRALDTAGAAIGVGLAIVLMKLYAENYSRVFLFATLPAIFGATLLFLTKEKIATHKSAFAKQEFSLKSFTKLPRRLKIFLIIVFIFALANSSNQFLLLRARNLGLSLTTVLLTYLVYNLVYGIFAYPIGSFSDRIGSKKTLVIGYALYGLVYLGFGLIHKPNFVWILFGIYGLYSAFTEGVGKALVASLAPESIRGTFLGLHATLTSIGLLPASILAGWLWNLLGASAPFYFGGGLGIIAAVGLFILL